MKSKQLIRTKFVAVISSLILITLACSLTTSRLPEVTNHPPPEISINTQPFERADCPLEYGFQRCEPQSPLGELGCQMIRPPGNFLGGLKPEYPIYICLTQARSPEEKPSESEFIYAEGCLLKHYLNYIIWSDDQFQLIKSQSDFKNAFAPIDSEVEALSYALGVTGYAAQFGLEANKSFRYYVDHIEDTHVTPTQGGYLVYLFDYRLCGCGPHPTYSIEILVRTNGDWQETNRTKIYEDPQEDSLCVD